MISWTPVTVPTYQHFEDLPVWQESARLYNLVCDLLETSGTGATFGFRNQLDRAALSVSNNIAEGFERATTNELLAFLAIARGSAGEVRSMITVVRDRPRLSVFVAQLDRIRGAAASCARQITAWISSIERAPVQGKRHLTPSARTARQARTVAVSP